MELTETYLKGFNHAYPLAQHKSQLIEQILSTATKNNYLEGMRDGKRVFEQEHNRSNNRLKELDQLRTKRDRDQEREL
jgi:hypothetical protein